MLPSLSIEFRLPVGVDLCSELFSSRATLAAALWMGFWDDGGGPSRLDRDRSWFFLDLNRNDMVVTPRARDPSGCGRESGARGRAQCQSAQDHSVRFGGRRLREDARWCVGECKRYRRFSSSRCVSVGLISQLGWQMSSSVGRFAKQRRCLSLTAGLRER